MPDRPGQGVTALVSLPQQRLLQSLDGGKARLSGQYYGR